MTTEHRTLTVGIDCGAQHHRVCVLNRAGTLVGERQVEHSGRGLDELAEWLLTLGEPDPAGIAIAIEVPRGAVVDTLLERGFPVYAINPKQSAHFRGRYSAADAKDDRRDAWALARALGTDASVFRRLETDDPQVIEVREWSRLDTELGEEFTRAANRLREHLQRYFPQPLQLSPAANEPWLWALLAIAPTPAAARACSPRQLERLLARARIRRFTSAALHELLATPSVTLALGTVAAVSQAVRMLVPRLQLLHQQRRAAERHLTGLLKAMTREPPRNQRQHHDVTILLSLPGVGVRVGATMLAEASRALATRDYHAIRAMTGLAPVTKASGKRRIVTMRYACNRRLRAACYHWARTATQRDHAARAHYTILRRAGHAHARALRGVADRLLAVLIAMLKSDSLYDHRRRRAA